jgi:hypothetical protein
LAHHTEQDNEIILLTASTPELQKFVLKHLGESELFPKTDELVRKTSK